MADIYLHYFGLKAMPFGNHPDPSFLCMLPHTQEALSCLEFGIVERKGFLVLTGEVGTGKTTLLRRALRSMNQTRVRTAFVFNPRMDVLDFLEFVLTDFGVQPATRTKSGLLMQLNRWLVERFAANELCLLIVDEAQNLTSELLEEIRLLTNLETDTEKLLQIILSGQPELEAKLREPGLRQLRQRISLWCRTEPLSEPQTAQYIRSRLTNAGSARTIFEPAAVDAVHRHSGGIPRLINLLCEHALLVAYADQTLLVTEMMVTAVAADLGIEPVPLVSPSKQRTGGVGQLATPDGEGGRNR